MERHPELNLYVDFLDGRGPYRAEAVTKEGRRLALAIRDAEADAVTALSNECDGLKIERASDSLIRHGPRMVSYGTRENLESDIEEQVTEAEGEE